MATAAKAGTPSEELPLPPPPRPVWRSQCARSGDYSDFKWDAKDAGLDGSLCKLQPADVVTWKGSPYFVSKITRMFAWDDWLITLCDPERFAVPTLGSAAVRLTLPRPVPPRPRVSPELEARFPTPPEEVEEHERRVHEFEQQLSTLNTQLAIADAEVAEAARAAADVCWGCHAE